MRKMIKWQCTLHYCYYWSVTSVQRGGGLGRARLCPCGETQTMSHIVESCPLTKLNGGLSRLYSADEDAVSWLTSYGSWHAYEKKWHQWALYTSTDVSCRAVTVPLFPFPVRFLAKNRGIGFSWFPFFYTKNVYRTTHNVRWNTPDGQHCYVHS